MRSNMELVLVLSKTALIFLPVTHSAIAVAKENGYRVIGYFMQSKLQECIARNNLREGKEKIPPTAIAATSNKIELPSAAEGYDELYFVANDGKTMKISKWRENDEL